MRPEAPWEPLLEGHEAERARDIAAEIAEAVRDLPPASGARGLLGGVGRAVFLAEAASAGLADDGDAADLLEADLVAMCTEGSPIGLWQGYAGLRWALAHLVAAEDAAAPLARIDAVIRAALAASPWSGHHDLADGLAGIALVLGDAPEPPPSEIGRVVDHLEHRIDNDSPELGAAHGLAGVVGATARLAAAGVEPERCRRLLARTAPLLLSGEPDTDLRAGWCRGEAGIALALLGTARATGDPAWEQEALDRASRAIRHAREQEPDDACICHGVAGLAHVLARLHQATGRDELRAAAVGLLRRTMAMRRPGEGAAGYPMRRGRATWVSDTSLLIGAAGVGLVLLAAITEQPPTWDSLLLADLS